MQDRLKKRAGDDTDCGKAIQRLLDKLDPKNKTRFEQSKKDIKNKASYIESLYKRVKGNIKSDSSLSPFAGNTGLKDYYVGGPKITYGPATESYAKEQNFTFEQIAEKYTYLMIHELIHNAKENGRYSDKEVLDAVIKIMTEDKRLDIPKPTDNAEWASMRINTSFMRNYCPNPE